MNYRTMCIQQGYVPSSCKMDGQLCWLLVNEGKDPCMGCNYNRTECNGRHALYESESYKFGGFIDSSIKAQRKRNWALKLAEDKKVAERHQKHSICNAKVVLLINTELNSRSKMEIELKVNDLISERGYIKKFSNIEEMVKWLPFIIHEYDVQQIQIDSNGYGKGIFDAVETLNLDIDIVPIIYQRMHLNY